MASIFVWLLFVLVASFVLFCAVVMSFSRCVISLQRDLSVTGSVPLEFLELPLATTVVAARRDRKRVGRCILRVLVVGWLDGLV